MSDTSPTRGCARFLLLGPLSVADGNDAISFRPSKPVTLLGALLLNANSISSNEHLTRVVWGEDHVFSHRTSLHTSIARLRKILSRHGVDDVIESAPGGYRLQASRDSLDLLEFREAVQRADATDELDEAITYLKFAMSLWKPALLSNIQSDYVDLYIRPQLLRERGNALQKLIDLERAAGDVDGALSDLWLAVESDPGNESYAEQLIEVLLNVGRRQEALDQYHTIMSYLREELGIDPSKRLQEIYHRVLDDESDTSHQRPAVSVQEQGDEEEADVPVPTSHEMGSRPRKVPISPSTTVPTLAVSDAGFVGRANELEKALNHLKDLDSVSIVLVTGPPGIGKSAFSARLASRLDDTFPGEHLHLNLSNADSQPRPGADLAAEFEGGLRRLEHRDRGADNFSGRILLVLDDMRSMDQIASFLVGGVGSSVIITSRSMQPTLVQQYGAKVVKVGALSDTEATAILADLSDLDPADENVMALAAMCEGNPLALRHLGAYIQMRALEDMAPLVEKMREDPGVVFFENPDPAQSLRAVFNEALDRIGNLKQVVFSLGIIESQNIDPDTVRKVIEEENLDYKHTLTALADCGLVHVGTDDTISIPGLLQAYVRNERKLPPAKIAHIRSDLGA